MQHFIKRTWILLFTAIIFLGSNISLFAKSENEQYKKINKEVAKSSRKSKKNLKKTTAPNWKKWKNSNCQKYFH